LLKVKDDVSMESEDLIANLLPEMLRSHKTILDALRVDVFHGESDPTYSFAYYDFYKIANANVELVFKKCSFCKVVQTIRLGRRKHLVFYPRETFDFLYERKYQFVTCSR